MGPKKRGAGGRSGAGRSKGGGSAVGGDTATSKKRGGGKKVIAESPPKKKLYPADVWWSSILPPSLLSSSSSSSTPWIGPFLLFLATYLAYLPSLSGNFVWDDFIFVESSQVTSWGGIWDIWTRPGSESREVHYWPVVYTTFWLEHKLYGGFGDSDPSNDDGWSAASMMRLTNLILHVMNALLVRAITVQRLNRSETEGWISAVIFALHPVRVESVAWIIERKDLLSGLFFLWALYVHPNSHPDGNDGGGEGVAAASDRARRRNATVLTSTALYVLGLLSKTAAVSLPVALLVVPWYHRGVVRKRDLLDALPLFVAGIFLVLLDMSFDRRSVVGFGYTLKQRVLIGTRAVTFYLQKFLFPADLVMIYPRWNVAEEDDPEQWIIWLSCFAFVSALLLVLGAAAHWGKMGRGPFACLLFFGAALGPSLGLVDYSFMQYSFVADRFQYLAAIGPGAVVAGLFGALFGSSQPKEMIKRLLAVTLCVLLLALGILTNRHSRHFLDDGTYFGHVVERNSRSVHGHKHLGDYLSKIGDTEGSIDAARSAVDLWKNTSESDLPGPARNHLGAILHLDLGQNLQKSKRSKEAAIYLSKAIEYDDKGILWRGRNWLGSAHSDLGHREQAVRYFHEAAEMNPRSDVAWGNLGAEYGRMGRYGDAVEPLTQCLELNPRAKNPRANRGRAYLEVGRYEDAVRDFRMFLELSPGHKVVTGWLEAAEKKKRQEEESKKERKEVGRDEL